MKKVFFRIYLLVIVLPLVALADWYGKNYVGEQIDDDTES